MENSDLCFAVESKIPYIKGLLELYGQVKYLAPDEFTPEAVADADALIVRTRTACNEALLGSSRCSFVATATIGTDHIDLPWCAGRGIEVANAPGCNAPAVAQYVFASLMAIVSRPLCQHTIGIVGVGHVGKIVERWARQLDMRVLICDPPRQQAEGGEGWSTLEEIADQADIITFHTPLDASTRHMADSAFFNSLRRAPIIINAARGPIVDTPALVAALDSGQVHSAVIDCWEGEPNINAALLESAVIATPHIAGYSAEGKARATRMALDALSRHFGLPHIPLAATAPLPAAGVQVCADGAAASVSPAKILRSYDPLADTAALKSTPQAFEALRNNYNLRHEVGLQ